MNRANQEGRELYAIADLAKEFDISTRTIRFYEAKGLLAPERVGATRVFRRRDRAPRHSGRDRPRRRGTCRENAAIQRRSGHKPRLDSQPDTTLGGVRGSCSTFNMAIAA